MRGIGNRARPFRTGISAMRIAIIDIIGKICKESEPSNTETVKNWSITDLIGSRKVEVVHIKKYLDKKLREIKNIAMNF